MQVILLDKVHNLGNLGDIVKVKDGYARNFLIPTKRADLEKAAAAKLADAQTLGEKLAGTRVEITQKAGVDEIGRASCRERV